MNPYVCISSVKLMKFVKDMTAFIAANATETIGFIATEADEVLTNWTVNLSRKYISIPTEIYELSGYVSASLRCCESI